MRYVNDKNYPRRIELVKVAIDAQLQQMVK